MTKRQVPGLDLWSFWAEGADFKAEMDPNLQTLSVLVHGSAKSRTTVLPGSGLAGDIYIVRDDAGSNANEIAFWDGASGTEVWNYIVPKEGWQFWAEDEDKLYVYDGSAWIEFEQGSGGGGSSGPSDTGYVARNARFWALLDLESGGTEVSAVLMEVRGSVGGPELVVTPSASSEDGSNVALNAYDDDAGTYWRSSGDNGQARFVYDAGIIGGDPNDPIQVNVAEIAITARGGGDEAEAPTRFILAYADDDGVFVPVARIVTGAWSADETKTFDVSAFTKRIEIAADDLRLDSTVALASGAYESTGLDLSDKDGLQVFFDRIDVDTSGEQLDFTLFVGGVEVVTGYEFRTRVTSHNSGGDENWVAQSAGTAVQITGSGGVWGTNAATSEISGMIEVYGIKDGDWKLGRAVVVHKAATGTTVTAETYFRLRSAGAITGWKIAPSAGNVESGDVYERLIEASAFGASETAAAPATTFVELTDTPGSLGTVGQVPRVASGGAALEFYTPPTPVNFPDWVNRTESGDFTLADADFNGRTYIRVNSASDVTITLNTGLSTNGPVFIEKVGAGDVLFGGTGTIVGSDTITTQYDVLAVFVLNTSSYNGRLLGSSSASSLPDDTGSTSGDVLTTDGAGTFTWETPSGGGGGVGSGVGIGFAEWSRVANGSVFTTTHADGSVTLDTYDSTAKTLRVEHIGDQNQTRIALSAGGPSAGADFDVVFVTDMELNDSQFAAIGTYVRDTSNGRTDAFTASRSGTMGYQYWTNFVFNSSGAADRPSPRWSAHRPHGKGLSYWRVKRTGTDIEFSVSHDGLTWIVGWTSAVTDNSKTDVDEVGIFIDTNGVAIGVPNGVIIRGVDTNGPQAEINAGGIPVLTIDEETGATYTVVEADLGGHVYKEMTNGTDITVTVPAGLSGSEPVTFEQGGVGKIIFAAGVGVTINAFSGFDRTSGQYASATLVPKGLDTYTLMGNIEAAP